MKLLIILQSHATTDSQKLLGYVEQETLRYPGVHKDEVSKRCVKSLIHSINHLIDRAIDIEIELKIFDDHSSEEHLDYLKEILTESKFKYDLESLSESGILSSFKSCFNYAKDNEADLVYFPQDDYLYEDSCLIEMIDVYLQFKDKEVAKSVCVYPYNDPYRYAIHNIVPVRIIQGMARHWRTSYQTASCFMLEHKTLIENWDLFEDFYNHPVNEKIEDDTINKLFQEREHVLFTPIPSLALHMQYGSEKDPYIDWTILWDKFKPIEKIELPERVLLNIGSGKYKLNLPVFKDLTEISYDIDKSLNPDIVGSLTNLEIIPTESIDVVWLSHVLEHMFAVDVPDILQNIKRIIKSNGVAIINVPNIKEIAGNIASGNIHHPVYKSERGNISTLDILYGFVPEKNMFMCHKTGFTQEYVADLLQFLGIQGYILESGHNLFILITKTEIDNICVSMEDVLKDYYNV